MFIWEFVASAVLGDILDWVYVQLVGFLSSFFAQMGNMGVDLFGMPWVQGIVLFFSNLGWALYVVGLAVACFECAIEYSSGRGDLRGTALGAIKGFFAASLFSVLPVRLYALSVTLQETLSAGLTGISGPIGDTALGVLGTLRAGSLTDAAAAAPLSDPLMLLFSIFLLAYAVIKIFFASLKRGGILLIQIAVGSLYLFGVPRGYTDGFVQWSKQIIGLCLTAFLQGTILTAGLLTFQTQTLLGLGLMLCAGEVPRIAGAFGLDTSVHANLSSAVYTVQSAVNTTRTILQRAPK